jgi:hypothetical protein
MANYIVVDLSVDSKFLNQWDKTLEFISASNDKLKNNYLNLNPKDFLSFTALIDDNKIICFSALQSAEDRWGPKIARCSTRMWIHPEYRFSGMTKFTKGNKFLNSYYLLPVQFSVARRLGIGCVFMSRESTPNAFKHWNDLVNNNTGRKFQMLEDRYNVCGELDPVPESCKQFVSLDLLLSESLDIWKSNMDKFKILN